MGGKINVIAEKNNICAAEADLQLNYPPALYHKMLDYRITEILMATLAIGAIVFFRLYR